MVEFSSGGVVDLIDLFQIDADIDAAFVDTAGATGKQAVLLAEIIQFIGSDVAFYIDSAGACRRNVRAGER